MRDETKATEPRDVLRDCVAIAAQRIRRIGDADADVVPVVGADLHAVEAQDAVDVPGGSGGGTPVP